MQRPNNRNLGPGLFFTLRKILNPGCGTIFFFLLEGLVIVIVAITVYNFRTILFRPNLLPTTDSVVIVAVTVYNFGVA